MTVLYVQTGSPRDVFVIIDPWIREVFLFNCCCSQANNRSFRNEKIITDNYAGHAGSRLFDYGLKHERIGCHDEGFHVGQLKKVVGGCCTTPMLFV